MSRSDPEKGTAGYTAPQPHAASSLRMWAPPKLWMKSFEAFLSGCSCYKSGKNKLWRCSILSSFSSLHFPLHVQLLFISGSHYHWSQNAVVLGRSPWSKAVHSGLRTGLCVWPSGSHMWGLAEVYRNDWHRYFFSHRWSGWFIYLVNTKYMFFSNMQDEVLKRMHILSAFMIRASCLLLL